MMREVEKWSGIPIRDRITTKVNQFLSASFYVSKRGAYWDRLCRDIVGRWLVGWLSRACTVAKRCILGLQLLWNTNRKLYPRNSMVQLSTPWGDPLPGNGPPVRRFLSNYFDLLFRLVGPILTKSFNEIGWLITTAVILTVSTDRTTDALAELIKKTEKRRWTKWLHASKSEFPYQLLQYVPLWGAAYTKLEIWIWFTKLKTASMEHGRLVVERHCKLNCIFRTITAKIRCRYEIPDFNHTHML